MNRFLPGILGFLAISFSVTEARSFRPAVDEIPFQKTTNRSFKIPFNVDPAARSRYDRIELWLSRDEGKTWEAVARAKATDHAFVFRGDRDGMHWFTVRTHETNGRIIPDRNEDLRPYLRVLIEPEVPKEIDPGPAPEVDQAAGFFDPGPPMPLAETTLGYRLAVSLIRSKLSACGCAGLR